MIVSNEELRVKLGIRQESKLRNWLIERSIPWTLDGKGKVVTTTGALDDFMRTRQREVWALAAAKA